MKVILCKQGEKSCVSEIKNDLKAFQETVGGLIESVPFGNKQFVLVCNEEGKLRDDLKPNRFVSFRDHLDVIYGDFFICGFDGEDFTDIPEKYETIILSHYREPHFEKDGFRIL